MLIQLSLADQGADTSWITRHPEVCFCPKARCMPRFLLAYALIGVTKAQNS